MKHFSDLLDTKPSIDIEISVRSITDNGVPSASIFCNDQQLYIGKLDRPCRFSTSVDLLDKITISVEMADKRYSAEKETAILIESIKIDGFEIVPDWTHLAIYDNDQDFHGATSYLGFNGVWKLEIVEPFYRWRHRVTGQGWLLEPARA